MRRVRCVPRVIGDVECRWLDDRRERLMALLCDVGFVDSKCRVWEARKGLVIDGASFWFLLLLPLIGYITRIIVGGDPYTGHYRIGSVLHDAEYKRIREMFRWWLTRLRNARRMREIRDSFRDFLEIHRRRARADRMFYDFARFRGQDFVSAQVMWTALRWAGWTAILQGDNE